MRVSPGGTYYDNDELDALFKAVGFVVIQWSQAKHSLDLAIGVLYKLLGGKALKKRLPKMLATKLKFIEKCLVKLPTLARFRADGEALLLNFAVSAQRVMTSYMLLLRVFPRRMADLTS
jgi:hypothetical protein